MGIQFYPRGGSAQVARYLLCALRDAGWTVSLAAGSLGPPGLETNADTFFQGLDVNAVDYTASSRAFDAGDDPFAVADPMHPSYEDRADVPDRLLASVSPELGARLTASWEGPFAAAGIEHADVVHLHHLTAQQDAVKKRWPTLPVVAHLHGTELKFLESVNERIELARAVGHSLATIHRAASEGTLDLGPLDPSQRNLFDTSRWGEWRHGEYWRTRLLHQAQTADQLVTVSPADRETALTLLGIERSRVSAIPNGVEIDRFSPVHLSSEERRAHFRHWLVGDPQGWDRSSKPGSVAYSEADLDRLLGVDGHDPVLIYVGRFTHAKRVPLLIRAFARARQQLAARPLSLIIWGGHPGEWEGEHPVDVARVVGDEGIYFAGWRGHNDLPAGLAACDALVMPSVNDSFAGTALEAMAAGLPVLATQSGGFPSMINLDPARPTGWLIAPDDLDALTDALLDLVSHPSDVAERGRHALAHAHANLSWEGRVPAFEAAYAQAIEHCKGRSDAARISGSRSQDR